MKLERWSLAFYRLPYSKEVRWSNAIEREGVFALIELVARAPVFGDDRLVLNSLGTIRRVDLADSVGEPGHEDGVTVRFGVDISEHCDAVDGLLGS